MQSAIRYNLRRAFEHAKVNSALLFKHAKTVQKNTTYRIQKNTNLSINALQLIRKLLFQPMLTNLVFILYADYFNF